jgi:uncharacterized damage-inducible protein DinB
MSDALRPTLRQTYLDVQRGTRRLIELVPRDKLDWAPGIGMMTLRELVHHLSVIGAAGMRGIVYESWERPPRDPEATIDGALERFKRSTAEVLSLFDGVSDAELARREVTSPWGATMTVARAMTALIEHDVHHRTQLFIYLKQLGLEVDSMTLFG